MRSHAQAFAPEPEPVRVESGRDLEIVYASWLQATGRGCRSYRDGARGFLARWPAPQAWADEPLADRLAADSHTRPFLTFLMLHGWLHPGYDWLVRRKIPKLLEYGLASPLRDDLARYLATGEQLGYSAHVRERSAERVLVRTLIESGRPLAALTDVDLVELEAGFRERAAESGRSWANDRGFLYAARAVLFHLGVLAAPPPNPRSRDGGPGGRFGGVAEPIAASFVCYLERLVATHARSTISGTAARLAVFGRHLASVDPQLGSLAELDRRRHIETYISSLVDARRCQDGAPISVAERRNRLITLARFLADIAEWGWPEAPTRRLIFPRDLPRLPRTLPRYLPPDADRRLAAALAASPNRLFADALLLARATGLRVGELVDLELDCVHEIPGQGAWLKVPLGKLDSERMVPLDDATVTIVDRIAETRSPGRPLPQPKHGRLVEFLLTHHGKRVSTQALRDELARAAETAGLGRITPHQLRHTYATALVNAGCSLQALMALLGHTSAAMSLRYGRLFDATVRADYERALTLAKAQLGPVLPAERLPLTDTAGGVADWRDATAIKARLAAGYCLRSNAQGVCPYTNICEYCPNFRTDSAFLAILTAQRADADTLARDADERGWGEEATRHRTLVNRLDSLLAEAQAQ